MEFGKHLMHGKIRQTCGMGSRGPALPASTRSRYAAKGFCGTNMHLHE